MRIDFIGKYILRLKSWWQKRKTSKFKKRIGKDVWPDPLPSDYLARVVRDIEKRRKQYDK